MIALLATAWALDCQEVSNMQLAGVPHAAIAAEISRAGTPVDMDFLGCLLGSHVDSEIVKAAARVHRIRPGRFYAVQRELPARGVKHAHLSMDCGSVEWRASTDGSIRVEGKVGRGDHLLTSLEDGRLSIWLGLPGSVQKEKGAEADVGLPQFDTTVAPKPPAGRPQERCGDLIVHTPADLSAGLETARADVRFHGLSGPLQVTDHFGNVEVVGSNQELRIRTTGGDVYADSGARLLDVDTVSGRMVLGVGPDAHAVVNTISGHVWLYGGPVKRLSINAVSGDVNVFAAFADGGHGEVVSHSGSIAARVPDGRIKVSSHSGDVLGPGRSSAASPFDAALLGPAWGRIWQDRPTRWWFGSGAVLSGVQPSASNDYDLIARAFSGNVDVATAEDFPTSNGGILRGMTEVTPRLEACGREQFERTGGSGHAVATFTVRPDGTVDDLSAPSTAKDPAAVGDGVLSQCVVAALQNLSFEGQGTTRVRWPVRFGPAIEPWSQDATRTELRAMRRLDQP